MRLAGLMLLVAVPSVAAASEWEQIHQEDGITVWRRSVPDTSFVEFRGRGIVDADVRKILAVLHDQEHKTEWMYRCAENRLIHAANVGKMVIYNRTGSNVPLVHDRDVVVETSLTYSVENRTIHIEANSKNDPRVPPIDGIVRMPQLRLTWDLRSVDGGRTEVTYQVFADPGGLLPAWVVNMVSQKIPYHTIHGLRAQAKKDYEQSLMVIERSFDWSKVGLSDLAASN